MRLAHPFLFFRLVNFESLTRTHVKLYELVNLINIYGRTNFVRHCPRSCFHYPRRTIFCCLSAISSRLVTTQNPKSRRGAKRLFCFLDFVLMHIHIAVATYIRTNQNQKESGGAERRHSLFGFMS